MKFNPKVGDLVYMRWDDHCSYSSMGWKEINKIKEELVPHSICETVGFVLDVTPTTITTASSIAFNDGGDDCSQMATRLRRCLVRGKVIARFPRPKDT